ncbi:Phosphoglucomutase-2 [Geodia barretti]|uniref:Phosphoglucomutase-2 n=1 Tax=Geodia barretti TaxID=519541 RepID=A0AA35SXI9_GEOBA|nr:Phosphoglucomutase-2 [Geodia barretti]
MLGFVDCVWYDDSQGLASCLLEQFGSGECGKRGVVVGYDARHNSRRFAELSATIFLNKNFKVYLFSNFTPTPYTPYAVVKFGCVAGVQVTASHNPKEYNGYKVYWSNGAQIRPPLDSDIQSHISANLNPLPTSWDTSALQKASSDILDPLASVTATYFTDTLHLCYRREDNASSPVKIVYTPMHGVGAEGAREAFRTFSLPDFIPVPEQIDPDPEFRTVAFPNPEEGHSALGLAEKTAERHGATLILANDPDADRLAVAERSDPSTREWDILTGNEIGALLGWWLFKNYRDSHPHFNGKNVYMLASTVSSKFLQRMASVEGFQFEETLTGFKWMGNRAHELLQQGHEVLFAFEEAIGYMCGCRVLDKDGISAAAVMAEFAGWLAGQGKNFRQQLDELYARYGRFESEVSYFVCHSQDTFTQLFNGIRSRDDGNYPKTCGPYVVDSIIDLTVGYDSSSSPPDFKPFLPVDPNSQLIKFILDDMTCECTLRTSGTEPKIKYYIEISSKIGETVSKEELTKKLRKVAEAVVSEFLQPERWGLEARPTQ